MKTILKIAFLILLFSQILFAGNIQRQGWLGVQLMPDTTNNAVVVVEVLEGGTAAKMDILGKDMILKLNNKPVNDFKIFLNDLKNIRKGNEIVLEIMRNGEKIEKKGKMIGKPFQTSEDYDIIYDEVPFQDGYLRSIITKPKGNGKYPSVFFVQGYTCSTIEFANPNHPVNMLVDKLTKAGYLVYRVEKPGLGDSQNTPDCMEIDFDTELEAFLKAYQTFLENDNVDKEKTFIFGHSLGGFIAPEISEVYSPLGVMVYGTGVVSWQDYMIELFRNQYPQFGIDYAETEEMIANSRKSFYEYFNLQKNPKEIDLNDNEKEVFANLVNWDGEEIVLNRHHSFWSSLNQFNSHESWKNTDSYVLAMYGEYDVQALDKDDAERIAEIVNHYNPGKGEFKLIDDTDHVLLKVPSKMEGLQIMQSGKMYEYAADNFNDDLVKILDEWMKDKIEKKSKS